MADRMHPYPMFPPNLNPGSLQQSQIPQQQPQSQKPDPQMMSALSNPEHSRMWQQMNQLQNAYRPPQSSDLAASQMNHQMPDFPRGQALTHGQGQPIVQQIQQSFGLNSQRVNPPGPVFHDPQANLPQLLMTNNPPNVPMNTQQQMKAAFNMNPMMHAALNNPGVSRQLKMQQEMARFQQSSLGAQHPPNQPTALDMFATTSMQPSQDQMHGSPHPATQPIGPPGTNQGMVPGNQQPGVQKKIVTPAEFQERRNYLLSMISQSEASLGSLLQTPRNTTAMEPVVQQKISQLRTELATRKDVYNKFVATFGAMVTQQMVNMPSSSMAHINPMAHSTSQQPQQGAVSNQQVQPGFVTQANQPVTPQYNMSATNGPSSIPPQGQGGLNQQVSIAGAQIGRPSTIPPRTAGTPHQMPGGQLQNNMSPNLGNFAPQGGQKVPNPNTTRHSVVIMPLDKERFESTYAQFCRSQNISMGSRVAIGEGRTVDLHQLHVHVMQEGGASSVTQRDMWPVIGGRMGFVQFPGTGSESGRSGPGIAQQLHNTYEQCLQHFENAYILTVKNRPAGAGGSPQQLPIHQMNPSPLPINNTTTPGMSGNPTEMASNAPRSMPNQQIIAAAARFAQMSAQDMRNQRVHEQMITFVERHRPELLKFWHQQMQMIVKRNAEQQEQQNNANTQGQLPNMTEQAPIGLQSGTPRPHQTMGANAMVGAPSGDTKPVNGAFVPENVAAAAPNQLPLTQDHIQHAAMVIAQLKHMFQQRSLPGMNTHSIPEEHRLEYSQHLDQLYKMTSELDGRLNMYLAVFKNEDLLRRYVAIVMTVARQRQLLSNGSSQYIIPLMNLRNMQIQVHKLNEEFDNRWRAMRATFAAATAANSHPHPSLTPAPARKPSPLAVPPTQSTPQMVPPVPSSSVRQVSINPSPPQQTHLQPPPSHSQVQPPHPPQPRTQANQSHPQLPPQQSSLPQPSKKPFSTIPSPSVPLPTTNIASPTPTPAAASSTPATSAPTPQTAAASPQTPKSPPSKAAAKSKGTARITRKTSTAGKSSATPEIAPASVAGVKRPSEEDFSAFANVAPSEAEASNAPSPKKAKTEWEGEPSEALIKRQQEIENIKTEDEAAAFLDQMKELFDITASTDSEIQHDIASTLGQIADAAATAAALSVHGAGDAGPPPTSLSPHMGPANDAFLLEFLDFSSFTTLDDEDNDSKAPTPDLVPSSETNLSPESGSEGDLLGSTGSPDKTKIEELGDRSDPLRLGSLREIDGGESAYYQGDNWKWEGPMHTLDQPWAIFTS